VKRRREKHKAYGLHVQPVTFDTAQTGAQVYEITLLMGFKEVVVTLSVLCEGSRRCFGQTTASA
jgi:hypothetical protein